LQVVGHALHVALFPLPLRGQIGFRLLRQFAGARLQLLLDALQIALQLFNLRGLNLVSIAFEAFWISSDSRTARCILSTATLVWATAAAAMKERAEQTKSALSPGIRDIAKTP
jgi:hypothetical protein